MTESLSEEQADFKVLQAVTKYIFLLTCIPLLTFFMSKLLFFDFLFGTEGTWSNVTSAIVAVAVLHIALGHYIYTAYSEAEKAPKPVKAD